MTDAVYSLRVSDGLDALRTAEEDVPLVRNGIRHDAGDRRPRPLA